MRGPVVVVTGTGTGIGKTHVAAALLRAWGANGCVAGLKPVETGVPAGGEGEDAARLRAASTFHVKPWPAPPFTFVDPVSPHLAAREERRVIELPPILDFVDRVAARAEGTLVELAGGLFSPLGDRFANADVARELRADAVLLVAPNRLGVLHDVAASSIAARARGLELTGVVLVDPESPDASTDSNAAELPYATWLPVLARVERGTEQDLARSPSITALVRRLPSLRRA